ncbi:hypothetical protein ACQY0O_000655 [Thecaphora frezii]
MGVKGLTSYVRSVARTVSEEVTLPVSGATSESQNNTLVVDGWAWIYTAYLQHFPDSVRGGDYDGFSSHLSSMVAALRAAELEPIFVFDGPYLPLKLTTVLERSNSTASINSAFMRSTSRTSPRFQLQMGIVPPLLYDCTIETLLRDDVQTVIAESEADSAVAETAERMQGWAVSNDSDFFILCARGRGCKGYVPIDTIEYLIKLPQKDVPAETIQEAVAPPEDDDGFAPVGKKGKAKSKSHRNAATAQTLPQETVVVRPPHGPEEGELVAVRFTSYSCAKLSECLDIPPGMLPLFAAIVGNDYSSSVQARILGQALPAGADRISRVATILKEERRRVTSGRATPATAGARSGTSTPLPNKGLLPFAARLAAGGAGASFSSTTSATATPTKSGPHPAPDLAFSPDPVRDMVQGVVERILARPENTVLARYVSSGEKEEVVDSIIESVCTYSLLTLSTAPHLSSPSARFFTFTPASSPSTPPERAAVIREYQNLYTSGHFDKMLVEVLTQRIYLCKLFCEDPDLRSVQVTHARALRRWLWAVLFEVWGMTWARETMEEPESVEQEDANTDAGADVKASKLYGKGKSWIDDGDDDELIYVQTPPSSVDGSSVAESDAEDEDEDGDVDPDDLPSRPGSVSGDAEDEEDQGPKPPPAVVEYARKGDRLVGELCEIVSVQTLLAERQQQQSSADAGALPVELQSLLEQESVGPAAGASEEVRLSLYLYAHSAASASTAVSWDKSYLPLLATLRYLIMAERERLGESYLKSNWTKLEVIAAVVSATRPSTIQALEATVPLLAPTTRSIHLHTSLQLTLLSSYQLAQALRLVPHHFGKSPSQLVNGDAFHRTVLSAPQSTAQERYEANLTKVEREMVEFVLSDGVEQMLSIDVEAIRREKREQKRKARKQEKAEKEELQRGARGKVEEKRKANAFAFLNDNENGDEEGDEEGSEGSDE